VCVSVCVRACLLKRKRIDLFDYLFVYLCAVCLMRCHYLIYIFNYLIFGEFDYTLSGAM